MTKNFQQAENLTDIPSFDVFMNTMVSTLPQVQHIREEDAKMWYNMTLEREPERFLWHFERLKGFGGSDMGEIVASHLGEYNVFKTTYDIINEKLMRKPIDAGTKHTLYGQLFEDSLKRLFQETYNLKTAQDLVDRIDNHVSQKHPWLRSNVDDVVIPRNALSSDESLVFIIDYKNKQEIPKEPTTAEKVQVHQYQFALAESGFNGEVGRAIVYNDFYNKEALCRLVDLEPEIVIAMRSAGDEAWEHVLNDTKPSFSIAKSSEIAFTDDEKEKLHELERKYAKAKIIEDAAKEHSATIQNEIKAIFEEKTGNKLLKGNKLPLDVLGTTIRQVLVEPEAETLISKQNLTREEYVKKGTKLDEAKVRVALAENGLDPKDFLTEQLDIQKVIEFCEKNGFEPPVKETVSPTFKASKALGITKDDIADFKAQGSDLIASIQGDISLNEFELDDGPTMRR